MIVSIHVPRAGRDTDMLSALLFDYVSIHAPRAGRDCGRPASTVPSLRFNPRAPCGARLGEEIRCQPPHKFQSTRPVRGATSYIR